MKSITVKDSRNLSMNAKYGTYFSRVSQLQRTLSNKRSNWVISAHRIFSSTKKDKLNLPTSAAGLMKTITT